jgi:hypothetical protein
MSGPLVPGLAVLYRMHPQDHRDVYGASNQTVVPAVVTSVLDASAGVLNLMVLPDGPKAFHRRQVRRQDPKTRGVRTWDFVEGFTPAELFPPPAPVTLPPGVDLGQIFAALKASGIQFTFTAPAPVVAPPPAPAPATVPIVAPAAPVVVTPTPPPAPAPLAPATVPPGGAVDPTDYTAMIHQMLKAAGVPVPVAPAAPPAPTA